MTASATPAASGPRTGRDPVALGAGALLLAIAAFAAAAPWLLPAAGLGGGPAAEGALPPAFLAGGDPRFLLGTDAAGRDLLALVAEGTGALLLVAGLAVLIEGALGLLLGLLAGVAGGPADRIVGWLAGLLGTLSTPLVAIGALALLDTAPGALPGTPLAAPVAALGLQALAIGLAGWPTAARTVRAHARAAARSAHMETARAMGLRAPARLARHVLPGAVAPLLAVAVRRLALALGLAAALGFLGLGLPGGIATLGATIRAGLGALDGGAWWALAAPVAALLLALAAIAVLAARLGATARPPAPEPAP